MTAKKLRNSLLLVLTAMIWGTAFVAQSTGGAQAGPYTFNCIRSILGGLVLLPVIALTNHSGTDKTDYTTRSLMSKNAWIGGIICGIFLFFASTVQQLGLYLGAEAGKAGFLTACYILVVPILGLFVRKKCGWNIWVGVGLTLVGLYLLCMTSSFSLKSCDLLLLLCALLFSGHIMVIDYFAPRTNGVWMACIQFFVCGLLGLFPMFFLDMHHSVNGLMQSLQNLSEFSAWIPILYAGIFSCGIGYTLQIIGQNGLNPTVASLLMSLESVFSVIAGAILLGEVLSTKELLGCGCIFIAICLAQLPVTQQHS